MESGKKEERKELASGHSTLASQLGEKLSTLENTEEGKEKIASP